MRSEVLMKFGPAHCCLLFAQTLAACSTNDTASPEGSQPAHGAGVLASAARSAQAGATANAVGGGGGGELNAPATAPSYRQTPAPDAGTISAENADDAGALPLDAGPILQPPVHCGDVVAAEHPAFAAIKRLASTQQEVRVLVYGQSISMQAWWTQTERWLKDTYPNGKLVMENHAHGGCSSQCLIGHEPYSLDGSQRNRLPEDVFAWKPDLILFHVYGDHIDYGYIMRAFSEGCAAFDNYQTWDGKVIPAVRCTPEQRALSQDFRKPEVLVQGDFVISAQQVLCPAQPTTAQFGCFMNNVILPEQTERYMYRLQDNFHAFPDYIARHHLDPSTLIMRDQTHLSEPAGTDVMFALTVPHLCYKPKP
jgi:hypothetical protein